MQGEVIVNGGTGGDTVHVHETMQGRSYRFENSTIGWDELVPIRYLAVEAVTAYASPYDDVFCVVSTPPLSMWLAGRDGDDTYITGCESSNLSSTPLNLTFYAGPGNDTALVNDLAASGGQSYRLWVQTPGNTPLLTRETGPVKHIAYPGVENLFLSTGAHADRIRVEGTGAGAHVTVNTGFGNDTLTALGTTSGSSVTYLGGIGEDVLEGFSTPNTFEITGPNGGTVQSGLFGQVTFSGVESLAGGPADDAFHFRDGMGISGSIDGRGGNNVLNYSLYSSDVFVSLLSNIATGVGSGIQGIRDVEGGSANDTLVGDERNNHFRGRAGRDLLIGGLGQDVLEGGLDEDILISGTTAYDWEPGILLNTIMAIWTEDRPQQDRIRDLLVYLNPDTVWGDCENVLLGGEGDDLFFGNLTCDTTDWDAFREVFVEVSVWP